MFSFVLLPRSLAPARLVFSCPSESQPSLKETGDLRAQGEVTCLGPSPSPSSSPDSLLLRRNTLQTWGFVARGCVGNPLCLVLPAGVFESCLWNPPQLPHCRCLVVVVSSVCIALHGFVLACVPPLLAWPLFLFFCRKLKSASSRPALKFLVPVCNKRLKVWCWSWIIWRVSWFWCCWRLKKKKNKTNELMTELSQCRKRLEQIIPNFW